METPFNLGDVYRMKVLSSKWKGFSAKLERMLSYTMVITKFLKPDVVQLAITDTGVVVHA
jgi:hypothetical protein